MMLDRGQRYEGFEIVREIGAGTFARVYEARRESSDQSIALKLSREPVDSRDTAVRATREVHILELLSSPHVVRIHDHGLGADRRWYVVMELLHGADLEQLHDFEAPMDPRRACALVRDACLGLAEAHELGIVHRDIKPENLWIEPSGRCKLLDFGFARTWDPNSELGITVTTEHTVVGTPHYIQPEQLRGEPVVPASDVYSLGVIFYELLSARAPLFADEARVAVCKRLTRDPLEWLSAHASQPLVPLDRYPDCRARLPPRLMALVHRMLDKDPAGRPTSARVVARELDAILDEELPATTKRPAPAPGGLAPRLGRFARWLGLIDG